MVFVGESRGTVKPPNAAVILPVKERPCTEILLANEHPTAHSLFLKSDLTYFCTICPKHAQPEWSKPFWSQNLQAVGTTCMEMHCYVSLPLKQLLSFYCPEGGAVVTRIAGKMF